MGGRSRRRRERPSDGTSTGTAPRAADRPKPGRPAPDAGAPAADGDARRAPYIVLVAALSLFLLAWPDAERVWVESDPPWWLADATTLFGVVAVWVFARALVVAELRAMSLGEHFRDDATAGELLNVALARTGVAALWATLLGFLSIARDPLPAGVKATDAVGTYATVGAILGLALCSIKSYSVHRSSFRLLRGAGDRRHWIRAHMSAMVCDVVILTLLLAPLGRLVHHGAT
ncbi:hypothetical protein NE236_35840 [Actinoallomurus purpureus]|uniref:hypothetical protein n=1 Tax=Actinoallomurus purpureus TaxID=478114 RepID=UPI002092C108|nr:hypothetical protein [Actinoallomurus purpureus]MCO6010350.1 hypothetical protein [Actinoallomurus purpureus]